MSQRRAPKISLGFVVRRCTLELGHTPGAKEFSEWANTAGDNGAAIFGRRINADEAAVILETQAGLRQRARKVLLVPVR